MFGSLFKTYSWKKKCSKIGIIVTVAINGLVFVMEILNKIPTVGKKIHGSTSGMNRNKGLILKKLSGHIKKCIIS